MRYRGAILKLFGLIGSLSSACFIPAYASEVRPTLPLFEHAYEPRDLDERGLWQKWDEYEKEFARSPAVYHAPDLVNYVKGVLCETVGFDRCGANLHSSRYKFQCFDGPEWHHVREYGAFVTS